MSLINDALKRRAAATIRVLPAEHQGSAVMQPVQEDTPRNTGNPLTYGVVALVALAVITVSGLLLKSKTAHMEEAQPVMALAGQNAQAASANAALYPVPIPLEAPVGEPIRPVAVTAEPVILATAAVEAEPQAQAAPPSREIPLTAQPQEPVVQMAAAAPTAPATSELKVEEAAEALKPTVAGTVEPAQPAAPAEPAKFPELQLQAIHYRLKNPTVMLNGKTLRLGQTIEGAKITAIHRYGVEITWRNEKKFLALD